MNSPHSEHLWTLLQQFAGISVQEATRRAEEQHPELKENPLLQGLLALFEARFPGEMLAVVQAHPVLLSDAAEAMLSQGIENARQLGDETLIRHVEKCYATVRQVREQGADPRQVAGLAGGELVTTMDEIAEELIEAMEKASSPEELTAILKKEGSPALQSALAFAAQVVESAQPSETRSYAGLWYHTCPACGQAWEPEVWQIVDGEERPDLVARIHEGTLHNVTCPACGEVSTPGAPLLYHSAPEEQLLFAVPTEWSGTRSTHENDRLFSRLHKALELGRDWPTYLKRTTVVDGGLPLLSRHLRREVDASALLPLRERRISEALEPELRDRYLALLESVSSQAEQDTALQDDPELRKALARAEQQVDFDSELGEVPKALQPVLDELSCLARSTDMPRRIQLCRQALKQVKRATHAPLWAHLQARLADALAQSPTGNRAENLERALHHYNQALEVFTCEANPQRWAYIQNNLANVYKSRTQGDRTQNIEQAIRRYTQALEVYTRRLDPEYWATVQSNLGNAYVERMEGNRAENLKQAIHHYKQALKVYTLETNPRRRAAIENNLANVYWAQLQEAAETASC